MVEMDKYEKDEKKSFFLCVEMRGLFCDKGNKIMGKFLLNFIYVVLEYEEFEFNFFNYMLIVGNDIKLNFKMLGFLFIICVYNNKSL